MCIQVEQKKGPNNHNMFYFHFVLSYIQIIIGGLSGITHLYFSTVKLLYFCIYYYIISFYSFYNQFPFLYRDNNDIYIYIYLGLSYLLYLFNYHYFCFQLFITSDSIEVFISDGTSEKGAHVWSDLGYLIFLRYLFRSRADKYRFFPLYTCATCSMLPSNISTMVRSQ